MYNLVREIQAALAEYQHDEWTEAELRKELLTTVYSIYAGLDRD